MRPPSTSSVAHRFSALQNLFGLLAAVMVLFGQSAAVGAVQSESGVWIEVCAGSGTKLVQLDGEAPTRDCSHCDYCIVQFSAVSAGALDPFVIGRILGFTPVRHEFGTTVHVDKAEQFWAANRGPPLKSEVNMIPNSAQWAAMTIPALRGASWL